MDLDQVFGVSSNPVASYVERDAIDDRFSTGLKSGKQLIVYGSSKQGKTALVSKHLPYAENIVVRLTPKMSIIDIYHTILSKANIRITSTTTERRSSENLFSIGARVKAGIPLFGSGTAKVDASTKGASGNEVKYDEVPINLELPQHVADLLDRVGSKRWIILENFHYLPRDLQKSFAFDLRSFQELGIKFVILGVWREKNRMSQFNGDLLDRVIEIPVEPWEEFDFRRVAEKGAEKLRITFSGEILDRAIAASFSSIGVFQELLKGICAISGVDRTQIFNVPVHNMETLERTINDKANHYAARHQHALEAIAAGHPVSGRSNDRIPLFLPYYLVRIVLENGFDGIAYGMRRSEITERIRHIHHRGDDVRASDMSNLLHGLVNLQATKGISPPIIDYDDQNRMLHIIDSTFYFFIKHADIQEALESIPDPTSSQFD